ncbi:MAG: flagellar biosynthetic protein FliR [Candidatus Sulfotelmatobacter sp.]|jgi:flagellar biosynthetic protein FliR
MTDGLHLEELLAAALFTGARVSGLMVFCPVLGSDAVPIPLKAGLTVLLTLILHPLHGPVGLALSSWQWLQVGLSEVVIGVVLGLAANFLFEAALMAGQILGVQIGYSLANVFDPQTQADTPVLSEFHRLAALLIFLQLDVHYWLLRSLVHSFAYLPPGAASATLGMATGLLHAAGGIFLAGVQIAAPSLVATLVADMALGFLGKASPQLPVLFIGLAVKNLVGLTVLIAAMAYWPRMFNQGFAKAIRVAEGLLHLAR